MRINVFKRIAAGAISMVLVCASTTEYAFAVEVPNQAVVTESRSGEVITGTIANYNFSNYTFAASTETRKTMDNGLFGYIDVAAGVREADLAESEDGVRVLKLHGISSAVNSYKSGLSLDQRFGVEFKVRFGDISSQRSFFQMKGLDEGSGFAWPTLLTFAPNGIIKNAAGIQMGTYEANTWYTVSLDIDTPNRNCAVKVENGTNSLVSETTLDLGGSGDRIWRGVRENKAFAQTAGNPDTSWMEIAYVKAGAIVVGIEEFLYQDITMAVGDGRIMMPAVKPQNSYTDEITYVSSDESVVKTFGNGLLAMAPGETVISTRDPYTGLTGQFAVTVTAADHQWAYKPVSEQLLNQAIWSGYRQELNYTQDQIRELFQTTFSQSPEYYRDMQDSDFIRSVTEDFSGVNNPTQLQANRFEKMSRYLVLMYRLTDQWEYARKAGMILYTQAMDYPRVLLHKDLPYTNDLFKESEMIFGGNLVFSFGYLLEAVNEEGETVWQDIAPEGISEEEVTSVISELYLRPLADNCMDRAMKRPSGRNNIDVYGARSTAVLANVLNDPYLIRKVIMLYDDLMSNRHYYFDGMWEEGSLSYGNQTVSNVISGVEAIKAYTDPVGYEDPLSPEDYGLTDQVMGLILDGTDLKDRWVLIEKTEHLPQVMVYPNGTPIAINDTHFEKSLDIRPIQPQLLHNIELPGFGYYGLVQGNTESAVHVGLAYQAKQQGFAGSHDHANVLSMTLWGGGQELLPDTGYVIASNYSDGSGSRLRFPAMRPVFHNMPWIFQENGNNEQASKEWSKPRLLSYDDGNDNGGIITLVEASQVGPDFAQVETNQRLLMNISLGEGKSYVFDLSRMKGGQAHQLFQRGSELENMEVTFRGISLEEMGVPSLAQAAPFQSFAASHQLVRDMEYLKNPKTGNGSTDFSFTWEGKESGSRITTYMNGVEGSKLYLSSIPTPRRIGSREEEAVFTAPHVTRYRGHIAGDGVTSYGAVHETAGAGEQDQIQEVTWLTPDEDDAMGIMAVVKTQDFIDYIYLSGDTTLRTYDGISFAGKTSFLRKDAQTGEILYSYVYGQGNAGETTGIAAQNYKVLDLETAPWLLWDQADLTDNIITLEGIIPDAEDFIGKRGSLVFGDGSGYGVKIKGVAEDQGNTVVTIDDFMPATKTADGVRIQFHPHDIEIPGEAYLILEKGYTGTNPVLEGIRIQTLPFRTLYEAGEELDTGGMVVLASMSDAVRELGEDEYEVDTTAINRDEPGTYEIIVRYKGKGQDPGKPMEDRFYMTVVEDLKSMIVKGIKVTKKPDRLVYAVGDRLDPAGMEVTRYWTASPSNASPSNAKKARDLLAEQDYELEYDFTVPGKNRVLVLYQGLDQYGEIKIFRDEFFVTVTSGDDE